MPGGVTGKAREGLPMSIKRTLSGIRIRLIGQVLEVRLWGLRAQKEKDILVQDRVIGLPNSKASFRGATKEPGYSVTQSWPELERYTKWQKLCITSLRISSSLGAGRRETRAALGLVLLCLVMQL
jgi:hypothetical protein